VTGLFSCKLLVIITLVAAGWPGFSLPARAAQPQPQSQPQHLRQRHVPLITKHLSPLRRLDSGAHLDLAIGLPLRNGGQLTNLLADIYRPSSPNFRHFLTVDEFTASFAPSQEDYQAAIDFAKAHGLTVKHTHTNRTLLDVNGSVADIEKAFNLHLHVYQHPVESRTFFAPDAEPAPELATPLLAISGLDSYVRPRPQIHPAIRPAIRPLGFGSGSGAAGYYGYDFLDAYLPQTTLDGSGQAVALFELTGYSHDDIADYITETLLPGTAVLTDYSIDGGGDDSDPDYAVEATADVEMAISMAPNLSTVYVYEGPTPQDIAPIGVGPNQPAGTTAQINDVFNQMAVDNYAAQISCSYLMDINLSTVQIFEQFAAQGQSFFQGSGDFGAYSGAIDQPADDPYITVVGGTTLTTEDDGSYFSETSWLAPASPGQPEEGSGGGVSLIYSIPWWQQGVDMSMNQGSTTMRNLPDVALIADGVDIVYGNDYIGFSIDFTEAGTSLAAPLWAGFMALVNQQAAMNKQPRIGFANPALYAIGNSANYDSCFNDVYTGNNFTSSSPNKYSATFGYDLCTGWGTINDPLISALLAPPTDTLLITPPAGFTSSGPSGGPYSVNSQTYTLLNLGTNAVAWNLTNSANWLTVSQSGGILNSGASTTVTVSLNSAVNGLLIGHNSGSVTFANLTQGTFQSRQFDLDAGNGGFETGGFDYWTFVGDTNRVYPLAGDDTDVGGTNALTGAADQQFVHSGLFGAFLSSRTTVYSLSRSVGTTAGQRYVVSFWLTSVAEQGKTTPNSFAALWNGSALFTQTNLPAFGWTNLQFIVPATTASTPLEFDFFNKIAAFGLDDVSVQTVPAPVFQSVVKTPGTINLTWSSYSNLTYQIQGSASLANPNWTNVGSAITASGNTMTASPPVGSSLQQFYRVALLPGP
jgi:Pro-kumamolisin, activation domain/Viral BACON domain